ncbi:MAG: (d)CMP kinase [Alphaproteobacteria bacterium]|nr:(d)CMP kinase [Alphaproteobacteria bacterium]MBU1517044.1 (d)CMP kinase [Alphaproteobacteria bacterium]MBU2093663.1 (d)CMP kinase [Alphaproteobacteria bacterium]MBU2308737.1 (d)CMP kinase [Alphaproteobacteria bacterium]MBU2365998.1 (d)CMP kinase [Alphaproteobacteria bacterium]
MGKRKGTFIVAVDGPAASGKGTIATRLGQELGLPVLDTGLLYRAVGVLMDRSGLSPDDEGAAAAAAATLTADLLSDPALRTRAAGELASRVAVHPRVRDALLEFQRTFARQEGGAVLDGRDIGTVICPEAPVKLFVTATPEIRAERRWKQLFAQGEEVSYEDVLTDIRKRDARDGGRDAAPMKAAPDSALLETTEMTIEQAADAARRIVEAARVRWEALKGDDR